MTAGPGGIPAFTEPASAPTDKKVSRRDIFKYCVLGGICLAGAAPFAMLLKETGKSSLIEVFKGKAPEELWKWSKEAAHYLKLGCNVHCQLCPNECILEPGDRSACRVRVNMDGKLYTLVYGNPCSSHVDPIEKKPLFHFLPQSRVFSIATAGCNLRCLNCQNWEISQSFPEDLNNYDAFPDMVVEHAVASRSQSIAYTYSEPTVFYEYMLDTARKARQQGIKNVMVTNGYINEKPLRELSAYLDAANVDLKSFDENTYNKLNSGHLQPVLNTLKILKEMGVWFEITTLVVPTFIDSIIMIEDMCKWILDNLGPGYPLHLSRFHPDHKLTQLPPTPVSVLEEARNAARAAGLHYVYLGNVPFNPGNPGSYDYENTLCPNCNKLLIKRIGFTVNQQHLSGGQCKYCQHPIPGTWAP
ncbi:AmmeMemoRadiSam system radical SAM enzyme [Planctomycetota bacterium]